VLGFLFTSVIFRSKKIDSDTVSERTVFIYISLFWPVVILIFLILYGLSILDKWLNFIRPNKKLSLLEVAVLKLPILPIIAPIIKEDLIEPKEKK
jgi:hypothetical protein